MQPFVLIGRRKLPPESGPTDEHVYDEYWQLWIDKRSGAPLVTSMRTHAQSSQFGETTMTKTQEGADQAEAAALKASQFGETTETRTREGTDQPEVAAIEASQFGETTETFTREGTDQTELASIEASQFGETTMSKTTEGADQEGADQTERAGPQVSDAPYSHF